MKVVVTGAHGKVGSGVVRALQATGHEVVATDRTRPQYERRLPDEALYWQTELTDAGDVFALVRGADAVVHAAAIPNPRHNPPHVIMQNNLVATFNVVEACVRSDVARLVYISSETVPGYFFAERELLPAYLPVDEEHPVHPQDPYALSKWFGEQMCSAASERSGLSCVSIRPSWVQHPGNYERNLGPLIRGDVTFSPGFFSYIDRDDLADGIRLAVEADLSGHQLFYLASPDNSVGRPFRELVEASYGDRIPIRELEREDASGLSIAKARRLLGYHPQRSWRDVLDERGRLKKSMP